MLKLLAGSFLAFLAVAQMVPLETRPPSRRRCIWWRSATCSPRRGRARVHRRLCHRLADQDQRHQRLCRLDCLVELLLPADPQPSGPRGLAGVQRRIALLLMELGIFKTLEHILGLYSIVAVGWVGALVADLVINKPLGLSPPFIEFKRAHLYDINPVGVGSMLLATVVGIACTLRPVRRHAAVARGLRRARRRLRSAPAIAWATRAATISRAPPRQELGRPGDRSAARSASTSSKPRTWRIARPIPGRSARCAARWRRAAAIAASRRRGFPTRSWRSVDKRAAATGDHCPQHRGRALCRRAVAVLPASSARADVRLFPGVVRRRRRPRRS